MNDSIKNARTARYIRIGYLCVVVALALAACAIGCMAVISSCAPNARYFDRSPMFFTFIALLALTVVTSFASLFIFEKERIDVLSAQERYEKVAKYSNGVTVLASLLVAVFALVDDSFGEWGNTVLILSLVVCLFYALKTFSRAIVLTVISGFGVFVLSAVIIASLYLDQVIELNSHFKLLVQAGAAGMIFGTIADLRARLSPKVPEGSKVSDSDFFRIGVRGYLLLKSISLLLCSAPATVVIIYFLEGNTAFRAHYFIYSCLYLASAVPSLCELISATRSAIKSHI